MRFFLFAFNVLLFCFSLTAVADDGPGLVYRVTPDNATVECRGKLFVTATLTNKSDAPVTVHWGDYAYDQMYQFKIENTKTKKALLCKRGLLTNRSPLPQAAQAKHFHRVDVGETLSYRIALGSMPGANAQYAFFTTPGKYIVRPKLHVMMTQSIDVKTGVLSDQADAWTGTLQSEPFEFEVVPKKQPNAIPLHDRFGEIFEPGQTHAPGVEKNDAVRLSGSVVNGNGVAVLDATVQLNATLLSSGAFTGQREETIDLAEVDDAGNFVFENVPPNCLAFRLIAFSPRHVAQSTIVERDAPKRDQIRIELLNPVMVSGRVVGVDGVPLPNVRVNSQTFTDQAGRFSYKCGSKVKVAHVSAWRSGYQSTSVTTDIAAATSGDWEIVLHTEQSLSVIGRARQSNGKPVANQEIMFHLTPLNPKQTNNLHWKTVSSKTDSRGNFRAVLPDANNYSAVAIANSRNGYVSDSWAVNVAKMSPGTNLGFLVFNNRCRLEIKIDDPNDFPDAAKRMLAIYMIKPDGMLQIRNVEIPLYEKSITVDSLSPGRYRIDFSVAGFHHLHQSLQAEIPNVKAGVGSVTCVVPTVSFGDIRGKVLMPDRQTPAKNVSFNFQNHGHSKVVQTDSDGNLLVKQILAGSVSMRVVAPASISSKEFPSVTVPKDTETDMGTIQLRRTEDDFGFVAGKLTYDNGDPVAFYSPQVARGTLISGGYMVLPPRSTPTKIDSSYKVQAEAGKRDILFRLGTSVTRGYQSLPETNVVAKVDIQVGKTIQKDLVLRRRKDNPKLSVSWDNSLSNVYLNVLAIQDELRWQSVRYTNNDRQNHIIDGVPAGRCLVFCKSDNYFAWNWIEEDAQPLETHFDGQSGSIELIATSSEKGDNEITSAERLAAQSLGFKIRADMDDVESYVIFIPRKTNGTNVENDRKHSMFTQNDNRMTVTGLGAGDYHVTIYGDGWEQEKKVTVSTGKRSTVKVVIDDVAPHTMEKTK